jgi:Ran GTPase-activating protein (RanGAP) involved in mRNA processing and transport
LASNNLGELILPEGWTVDYDSDEDTEVYKHTDGREQKGNPGKPAGIIAIANAIPDMGALSSANLLRNNIGTKQAKALAAILKEHPTLKSLCGNKGDETELDMSGKNLRAEGAIMLVPEIIDNGAMSSLNLSANYLATAEAGEILGEMLKANSVLKELDVSNNYHWKHANDSIGFAKGLSVGLADNGAMTSLNLASNGLGAGGAKVVAEAIKVTECTPAIILVPFSCPSDFSINCCCLLLSAG